DHAKSGVNGGNADLPNNGGVDRVDGEGLAGAAAASGGAVKPAVVADGQWRFDRQADDLVHQLGAIRRVEPIHMPVGRGDINATIRRDHRWRGDGRLMHAWNGRRPTAVSG